MQGQRPELARGRRQLVRIERSLAQSHRRRLERDRRHHLTRARRFALHRKPTRYPREFARQQTALPHGCGQPRQDVEPVTRVQPRPSAPSECRSKLLLHASLQQLGTGQRGSRSMRVKTGQKGSRCRPLGRTQEGLGRPMRCQVTKKKNKTKHVPHAMAKQVRHSLLSSAPRARSKHPSEASKHCRTPQ